MDAWKPKLKSKIREARRKVKSTVTFVRAKALEDMAKEFGLARRPGEPDNELFARLEQIPDFHVKVDQLQMERFQALRDEYVVENDEGKASFMDELKKL